MGHITNSAPPTIIAITKFKDAPAFYKLANVISESAVVVHKEIE
jgi:hypothetical protein